MAVFERFFAKEDFSMASSATDVVCLIGQFTQIGRKQVGAKQQISFGAGEIGNGVDSRRTATIRLDTTAGSAIAGKLRLAVSDANEIVTEPVVEDIMSNWNSGQKLARTDLRAGEDGFLKLLLNPDATATVDMSDTDQRVDIPVTVYTL
jgi:hypothetical protein